jgi:hypothetical protein
MIAQGAFSLAPAHTLTLLPTAAHFHDGTLICLLFCLRINSDFFILHTAAVHFPSASFCALFLKVSLKCNQKVNLSPIGVNVYDR